MDTEDPAPAPNDTTMEGQSASVFERIMNTGELLEHIFNNLEQTDLCTASRVCQRFNKYASPLLYEKCIVRLDFLPRLSSSRNIKDVKEFYLVANWSRRHPGSGLSRHADNASEVEITRMLSLLQYASLRVLQYVF